MTKKISVSQLFAKYQPHKLSECFGIEASKPTTKLSPECNNKLWTKDLADWFTKCTAKQGTEFVTKQQVPTIAPDITQHSAKHIAKRVLHLCSESFSELISKPGPRPLKPITETRCGLLESTIRKTGWVS